MRKIVVRVGLGAGAAVLGLMLGAGVAGADDSVRITGDEPGSVRITGDEPGSVRITSDEPGSVRITSDEPGSVRITEAGNRDLGVTPGNRQM